MNSEVALQAPAAVKAVRELTDDEINELQLPLPKQTELVLEAVMILLGEETENENWSEKIKDMIANTRFR